MSLCCGHRTINGDASTALVMCSASTYAVASAIYHVVLKSPCIAFVGCTTTSVPRHSNVLIKVCLQDVRVSCTTST